MIPEVAQLYAVRELGGSQFTELACSCFSNPSLPINNKNLKDKRETIKAASYSEHHFWQRELTQFPFAFVSAAHKRVCQFLKGISAAAASAFRICQCHRSTYTNTP